MNPVARWSLKVLLGAVLVAVAMAMGAPAGAASNTWGPAAALATARDSHTSTLLASGKVLVTGGLSNSGLLASAELFDPPSNTWSPAASMATARYYHTATLLTSGRVLVAGGVDTNGNLSSAALYDPASNTWTAAGSLTTARNTHTATLMPSGQVLVEGGDGRYYQTLMDYIHLNPVRAKLIKAGKGESVLDFPWSSVAGG